MASDKKFKFTITPEPAAHEIYPDEQKAICFTVTNLSSRPVTIRPALVDLQGPRADDREPLAERRWRSWLTITEPEELWLNANAVQQFKVDIEPSGPRAGTYKFRLGLFGIEDTDNLLDVSDEVSFTVSEKAVSYNFRRYAIIALILLGVAVLSIVGGLLLFTPSPALQIALNTPQNIAQGNTLIYTLSVTNTDALEARDIVLSYKLPEGVLAAVARVDDTDFRRCDAMEQREILCGLGTLREGEGVHVTIQAIPAPNATLINHSEAFGLTARFEADGDEPASDFKPKFLGPEITEVTAATADSLLFAYSLPTVNTVAIGEPFSYRLFAWHRAEVAGELRVTYKLPEGLRYASNEWPSGNEPLAAGSCRPLAADYFTLECNMGTHGPIDQTENMQPAEVSFRVIPTQPLQELGGHIVSDFTVSLQVTNDAIEAAADAATAVAENVPAVTTLATKQLQGEIYVIDSALFFDGVDDWVELNHTQLPQSFAIDMWVTPFSTNNNQALVGVHLPRGVFNGKEVQDGENLFLVGYYNDGLDVRLGTGENDHFTLAIDKKRERFHLAVEVRRISTNEAHVYLYIDGETQTKWNGMGDKEEACSRQCKVFTSAIPSNTETLNWVLGQDWDGGTNRHTSDFFNGTISDFRIWSGNQATVFGLKDRHVFAAGSPEANHLIGYWRLAPAPGVDLVADGLFGGSGGNGRSFTTFLGGERLEIRDPQQPENVAALYGTFWGESGTHYGNAVQFNGNGDGLVSNFTLPVANTAPAPDSASGQTLRVNLSLSTWIFVENVPTEDQWIVGYAPLLPAPEGAADVAAELQADLSRIGEEIEALTGNIQRVTGETGVAQTAVLTDTAALDRAYANLLDALLNAINGNERQIIDGNGAIFTLYSQQSAATAHPAFLPPQFGSPLRFPEGFMVQVEGVDLLFDGETDRLESEQKQRIAIATTNLQTVQASGEAAQAELAAEQAALDNANATLAALLANINLAREARNNAILAQEEFQQFADKLPPTLPAANGAGLSEAQQTTNARLRIELIRRNTAVHQANVAYLRALLPLLNLTDNRQQAVTQLLDALQGNPVYRALQSATTPDSNLISELRNWRDTNNNLSPEQIAQLTAALDALEAANRQRNQSASGLQAAQADQENALFALRDASTRQIALNEILRRDGERRTRLAMLFDRRRQAQEAVDASEDPAAAQGELTAVTRELAQERQSNLAELKLQLASTQTQEEILNELSPVLQVAIAEAYDAGRAAIEQQALADIVDKILAQFLAIEPCAIPVKSTQEVAFDAAKLAVELSILNDTAGRVKTAEVHLADVTQQQQCRQTQIGDARQNLKEAFIQLLENYLRAINAELIKAQDALQEAQDAQSKEQESDQKPVVLPDDLLDLLSEAIANEVSIDLNNYLCSNAFEFDQLVCDGRQQAVRQEQFASNDGQRPIPFGATVSLLTVAGGPTSIQDLNVRLQGTHSYVGDLTLTLIGPDGTSVRLMQPTCGSTDNFNLVFDDDGAANRPCPPTDGQRYRADAPLSAFNGKDSNGEWKLFIQDSHPTDVGVLQGWSLELSGSSSSFKNKSGATNASFIKVFENLKKFQNGESQLALNDRREKVGGKLNGAFNTIRYRTRWKLRAHIALVNEQLRAELQEGIAGNVERQAKQLLQVVLVDMDTTLRVLLNETNFDLQVNGALEPDVETAVNELDRRERYVALFNDLKSLTGLAKKQLDALGLADSLAQREASPQPTTSAPAPVITSEESEARFSLAAALDTLEVAQRKIVFLGKRMLPTLFQDPEPTPQEPALETIPTEGAAENAAPAAAPEQPVETPPTPVAEPLAENVWLALIIDSDGHVTLAVKPGGSQEWRFYKENVPVPTGEWLHYVGTVSYTVTDGTPNDLELALYRNGELSKQADSQQFPTNVRFDQTCATNFAAGFYFGSVCDDFFYEGQIDDVRLWQRPMEKAEVRQWRLRPREVFDEFAYWSFDEGPGTNSCPVEPGQLPKALRNVACDISPQGTHDVLIVGPKWTDAHRHRLQQSEQLTN